MLCRAVALLSCLTSSGVAQASSGTDVHLFTKNDAIWSAVFLAGSVALTQADPSLARRFTDPANHSESLNTFARNFAKIQEGTLTVGNLALWGIARLAKAPAMADITFHAAESVVAASVAAQVIRGPLGRSRPYSSNAENNVTDYSRQYDFHWFEGFTNFKYRAFPSIHTSSAFAVATVYTLETQRRAPHAVWIVAPIAYALAAAPGLARMYNGQHWASDIFSGAFLGTLAGAKIVRYNHVVAPTNRVNRFFLGDQAGQLRLGATRNSLDFTYSFSF